MSTQQEAITAEVRAIMLEFAARTGLSDEQNPPRRYLWTDAHAVCNFLSLYQHTADETTLDLAVTLIDQVHQVLGRHREDDTRTGWISGLSDEEGRQHPTAGGLRIGKKLNERGAEDAFDERLEWDRDGQYFHYLTKWMHALCRAGIVTGESRYSGWAIELAKAAYAGFARTPGPGGEAYLAWKMSIDFCRPLVPSAGLHDPLDGYVTFNELESSAKPTEDGWKLPALTREIAATAAMNEGRDWVSDDPLGIGGLLFDCGRVVQLIAASRLDYSGFAERLLRDTRRSLDSFYAAMLPGQPAAYRLAFRELGLSIGLRAVAKMRDVVEHHPARFGERPLHDLDALQKYVPLAEVIEDFWRNPRNQQVSSWLEHRDINSVMLATSLLPDQFLRCRTQPVL